MVKPSSERLSNTTRTAWASAGFLLGFIPAHVLMLFMATHAALPYVGWMWNIEKLGYSWAMTAFLKVVFDIALFLAWGFVHTLSAQGRFQKGMSETLRIPPQAMRMVFLIHTAVASLVLMSLWQRFDTLVWSLPFFSENTSYWFSHVAFWAQLSMVNVHVIQYFDLLEFYGFSQLFSTEKKATSGTPQLITTGSYGIVRHPMYLFLIMAMLVTPYMTVDRLVMTAGMCLYLYFGLPFEEEKCRGNFGAAYDKYQEQVPAILPVKWGRTKTHAPKQHTE